VSNLIFLSGDFSSGSTLLWTLFRQTGEYYCLYEPLHEKLLEYLVRPLQVYEHHFFIDNYFSEYKGFRDIPALFKPQWGASGLYVPPQAEADDLYRYLSYVIGLAFGRSAKVLLKENRFTFRLGWLRAQFPQAKVIHIHRHRDEQWRSVVQRAQAHLGKQDVGQDEVTFNGMNMARWCEDLQDVFPELGAAHSQSGYERFCKLWELSYAEHRRHADLSVDYWDLTHNFATVCRHIQECLQCESNLTLLEHLIVPPEKQQPLSIPHRGFKKSVEKLMDTAGSKRAQLWLKWQNLRRKAHHDTP